MYNIIKKTIEWLGTLTLIATAILVIWLLKEGTLNDFEAFKAWVAQYKILSPLIFILIQIIQVVLPIIPGGITTIAGFAVFGFWQGLLYNSIGIIIGSILLFILVQKFGVKFILLFVKEATFLKYEAKLESPGYERLFILLMISPISPADLLVMVTGLTNMSLKKFSIIMLITKPISIVGYNLIWLVGGDWAYYFFGFTKK
ncbi:VTT domain-containing protein [Streptococcus dentapri]|uniref:TVP38/TMEM64 family membrane protein n=1 Tax=Streptococcus dentapri TaxID=573564 RepID=A0ABV8CZT1_9STRE